ncbi:MAG: type II toxin-antitoxin system HicA family toxin, partial [Candidatus Puniceispirillaceae bacterium]
MARTGGPLTFNRVELALKKHGFSEVRQRGSNRIFKRQHYHGHVVLTGRGKALIPIGTVKRISRQS